jgi:hypothetical protein
MKVQELSDSEISVLACYDVEESEPVEILAVPGDAATTPKLRPMRIICLDDCAIPE